MTVKTKLGRGDLLSRILIFIGSELLSRLITIKFLEIMYMTSEGGTVGPPITICLSSQKLPNIEQLYPLMAVCDLYTGASGSTLTSENCCSLHQLKAAIAALSSIKYSTSGKSLEKPKKAP
jgi:hypothetical protein